MKKRRQQRPPIQIVVGFEPITLEKFETLPERVKDAIGQLVYSLCVRLAEKDARETVRMAA